MKLTFKITLAIIGTCLLLIAFGGFIALHECVGNGGRTDVEAAGELEAPAAVYLQPKGVNIVDEEATEGIAPAAVYTIDDLLDAIEWVESKGDAKAKGDKSLIYKEGTRNRYEYKAVGAYQIHRIYVDDVNRIMDIFNASVEEDQQMEYFTYEDRWDKKKSRLMTRLYLLYYIDFIWRPTIEHMARIHNGGPEGWKKESTKQYWLKVKARMEAVK